MQTSSRSNSSSDKYLILDNALLSPDATDTFQSIAARLFDWDMVSFGTSETDCYAVSARRIDSILSWISRYPSMTLHDIMTRVVFPRIHHISVSPICTKVASIPLPMIPPVRRVKLLGFWQSSKAMCLEWSNMCL